MNTKDMIEKYGVAVIARAAGVSPQAVRMWRKKGHEHPAGLIRAITKLEPLAAPKVLTSDDMLTVQEAADYIGTTAKHFAYLVDRGQISGKRTINGRVLIPRGNLESLRQTRIKVRQDDVDAGTTSSSQTAIAEVCDGIKSLLLRKNAAYGDSALNPERIFSKASSVEQLLVRIDDKLSRIAAGGLQTADEDTLQDLIGYLVLLKVALARPAP